MTDTYDNKDVIIKYTTDNVPIIKFMRHPSMGGIRWSDETPGEYGGCGIPIPEHKKFYEKCKKEGIHFNWARSE